MKLDSLETLALRGLQDILSAERQVVRALPLLVQVVHAPALNRAFEGHLAQTEEHVSRVEQILASMGARAGDEKCLAVHGLIAEGQKLIKEGGHPAVLDAALIAAQRKIGHYEIAAYGTAATLGSSEELPTRRAHKG